MGILEHTQLMEERNEGKDLQEQFSVQQSFEWQEKVYSPREMLKYAFSTKKENEIHKIKLRKFFRQIKNEIQIEEDLEASHTLQQKCVNYIFEQGGEEGILLSTITNEDKLPKCANKLDSELVRNTSGKPLPKRHLLKKKNVIDGMKCTYWQLLTFLLTS